MTENCKVILSERDVACGRIDIGQILGKWGAREEERIRVIILATEHRVLLTSHDVLLLILTWTTCLETATHHD